MCNLWTRKGFETKAGNQVDDMTSQLHLSVRNPNVCSNFITSQEVGKMERADFLQVRLGQ